MTFFDILLMAGYFYLGLLLGKASSNIELEKRVQGYLNDQIAVLRTMANMLEIAYANVEDLRKSTALQQGSPERSRMAQDEQ